MLDNGGQYIIAMDRGKHVEFLSKGQCSLRGAIVIVIVIVIYIKILKERIHITQVLAETT